MGRIQRTGCTARNSIGILALVVLLLSLPVFAQLPTGTILGVVKDQTGAMLSNSTVTIINTDTGRTQTVTTGDDGSYRAPALPVGNYEVKAEHGGFKTQTQQGLVLQVTQEMVVTMTLQTGEATEVVTVTSEAPLVNTTNSSLGGLVNEQSMSDLPLNGRNYVDLALLQPGIAHSAEAGTISSRTTGVWFSSNGAPPRSNHILLDGAVLNNAEGAISGSIGGNTLGVDGIREYQVITSMFSAEYGLTMGSQVAMVSKNGTNKLHGDIFEYLRNDRLDARNYFDSAATSGGRRLPPYKRNNFGGSIGGPLVKDKTFFHLSYEGLRENLGLSPVDNVFDQSCYDSAHVLLGTNGSNGGTNPCAVGPFNPTGDVDPNVMPLANLYPYPNVGTHQFSFKAASISKEDFGQARLDQNFSDKDSAFVRFTTDRYDSTTDGNYPLYKILQNGWNHFLTISESHIFASALVNSARLSYSRVPFSINKVAINPPGVDLTDAAHSFVNGLPTGGIIIFRNGFPSEMGPTGGNNRTEIQNVFTGSDDMYYTKGRHALKFGVLFNRFGLDFTAGSQATNSTAGEVAFGNNAGFLSGTYINYDAVELPPGTNQSFTFNTLGFYVQDDIRVSSRFTFNAGLRYEFNTTPHERNGKEYRILDVNTFDPVTGASKGAVMQNNSLKNFSPRLGFAYDPFGNGKTAIRSGFGIYYDVGNIGTALSQYGYSIPPLSTFSLVNNFTPTSPAFSVPFTFPVPPSLHTLDYHAKQPRLAQYNLTLEQQLPGNLALTASYVGSRGINLFTVREQNPNIPAGFVNGVPFWASDPADPSLVRFNPNIVTATMVTANGKSWYNALQIGVNKRFSHGLQAQVSYTWSKSLDTTEAQAYVFDCFQATGSSQGVQPFGGNVDKGPSCFDLPQNLRMNFVYHFPTLKSNNAFVSKLASGWWLGSIVSIQSGYPFSPLTAGLFSNSGVYADDQGDRPNRVTKANLAGALAVNPNAVLYDHNTVIIGDIHHWFNENMFTLVGPTQTVPCDDIVAPNCSFGHFGDAGRDILRGPHLRNWDLSINKDTKLGFLGEGGSLQFRAEIFNIMNHANFALPSNNYVYDAAVTNELPNPPGDIIATQSKSRQIQVALKIIF